MNGDEIPCVRNDQCFEEQSEHYCGPAIDRLAAYEDTGLTPEEIGRVVDAYGRGQTLRTENALRLGMVRDIRTDRLRELAEADRDGRVVALPCKVSDTVWVILDGMKYASKCVVEYATIGRYFTDIVFHTEGSTREQYGVPADAFGKTVFLTREEAEKALEAMKDGN